MHDSRRPALFRAGKVSRDIPATGTVTNISLISEPSTTSIPNSKHTIGARIQALTYLELGLPHFQITTKTGVSKA
jgi:hypothetical protein